MLYGDSGRLTPLKFHNIKPFFPQTFKRGLGLIFLLPKFSKDKMELEKGDWVRLTFFLSF